MDRITENRILIDKIDEQIMELLDERFNLSIVIGQLKEQHKVAVLDGNREREILNKASKYSHCPSIENIYKCIMTESKKLQ